MRVVSETAVVQIAEMRHHCVDSAEESLVLLNHKELVTAASQPSDRLSEVLREHLERAVCLLSANKDLSNYTSKAQSEPVNMQTALLKLCSLPLTYLSCCL